MTPLGQRKKGAHLTLQAFLSKGSSSSSRGRSNRRAGAVTVSSAGGGGPVAPERNRRRVYGKGRAEGRCKATKLYAWHKKPNDSQTGAHTKSAYDNTASEHIKKRKRLRACNKSASSSTAALRQTFLDLGQRDFDNKTCHICRMTYAPGVPQDEAAHRKFCAQVQGETRGVDIGAKRCSTANCRKLGTAAEGTAELFLFTKVIGRLQAAIDAELGFGAQEDNAQCSYQYIVCVADRRRAIGCVVVERIERAFEVIVSASKGENKCNHGNEHCQCDNNARSKCEKKSSEDIVCFNPDEPRRAVLGVRQVWVNARHRRKGIASDMLDAARASAVYSYVVPKSQLAFSQPTPSGRALAESYFKARNFLVYSA